jgi:hypothetical protein
VPDGKICLDLRWGWHERQHLRTAHAAQCGPGYGRRARVAAGREACPGGAHAGHERLLAGVECDPARRGEQPPVHGRAEHSCLVVAGGREAGRYLPVWAPRSYTLEILDLRSHYPCLSEEFALARDSSVPRGGCGECWAARRPGAATGPHSGLSGRRRRARRVPARRGAVGPDLRRRAFNRFRWPDPADVPHARRRASEVVTIIRVSAQRRPGRPLGRGYESFPGRIGETFNEQEFLLLLRKGAVC